MLRDAFSAEWSHLREWLHALDSPSVEPATGGDVHIKELGFSLGMMSGA